ncbi:hypothetical protein [Mycobacterium paraseoulense]|nr:hypothetical protein [Mycobacterium paraseoulense]
MTALGDPAEVEELLESVVAGIAITHGMGRQMTVACTSGRGWN